LTQLNEGFELNTIYEIDCLKGLSKLPSNIVNCVISSPPYNSGQEYEELLSNDAYESFITSVFTGLKRVLVKDGRICWIVAPTISRKEVEFPFPLEYITMKAAEKAKLIFWETIVWNQGNSEAQTAWGSWRSASAPFIRHQTERVLLFVKETRKRIEKSKSTEFREKEFEHATLDVWSITPETRQGVHPCPFPTRLVERCLKLLTYKGDIVLDPFIGSGQVGIACRRLKRNFIGFDSNPNYVKYAKSRLNQNLLTDYQELKLKERD
jgi:site-specific DNA-methyltransferase (adenine-specific)